MVASSKNGFRADFARVEGSMRLGSQLLDATQKKWLRDEQMRLKRGMQGEREAAHYLDHYFKDGSAAIPVLQICDLPAP
jgi:hypothetical protein